MLFVIVRAGLDASFRLANPEMPVGDLERVSAPLRYTHSSDEFMFGLHVNKYKS